MLFALPVFPTTGNKTWRFLDRVTIYQLFQELQLCEKNPTIFNSQGQLNLFYFFANFTQAIFINANFYTCSFIT